MAKQTVHFEEEASVLLRLKQGDELAFQVLYERYSRLIFSNIVRLVRSEAVAEDLLQDVFVKIWEHRAEIDPNLSFKAYLFTISRHFAFNFKRRLKLEVETAIHMAKDWEEGSETITTLLYAKETDALFHAAMDQLPEQRQRIYRLCKLDGKSYQEVADLLDISTATVRDHIVKANKFIRERLGNDHNLPALLLAAWMSMGLS